MDAIRSVENEVDKVQLLFTNCRDACSGRIDDLIAIVDRTRHEIDSLTTQNQTELTRQQLSIVQETCDIIQRACARITNSHRELHVPVSKIGKQIDKNFNANFASLSDTKLFQSTDNNRILNHAILQHFLRHGMASIAEELLKETKLSVDTKEIRKFEEVDAILTSLRKKDASLALNWAIKNRKQLRELNSPLEFKIHRTNMINLMRQGMDKQHEIIQYARENLQHLDPSHNEEIGKLMGGIIYLKSGLENSRYNYFLDPVNYSEIEDIFISNACTLLDLSVRSPISVALEAGCIALPNLLEINEVLCRQGVSSIWSNRDELPIEIDLGRKLQFHSTFSCPILKQQSSEVNPPMRLICGHVISRDALYKLSHTSNSNKLKCPYCPTEMVVSDAMQIHF